jgi:hypothetical protein
MEGRGKVAYDPRDFDNSNEERSAPKLTIMEEVLLLGLKDKAVSTRYAASHAGANLMLSARSLIRATLT